MNKPPNPTRLRSALAAVLTSLLVATALFSGIPADAQTGTTTVGDRPEPILVGEYSGHSFPADIDSYTELAGTKPNFVMWFQSWDEPLYYGSQMTGITARDVTPLITWSPGSTGFTMADLLAGRYDSYIISQAHLAQAWQKPLYIRLFHEMNGTWQSFGPNRTTSEQFVQGWQRVVDLFRAQGVHNVTWVWSPNLEGFGPSTPSFRPLYPGDAYVDWVGLDGYNFGSPWRSFDELYRNSYDDITSLTNKPLMVAEWGSTEAGGDKAAWIRDAFLTQIPQMPRIRAVVSFDRVAEADFRVNSSPAALAAYREVLGSPLYGGAGPADTQAPVVTLAGASPGATVHGTVDLSVDGTDDVGVSGVTLRRDGAPLATSATASLRYRWDTARVADGHHTMTATAVDAAGNAATSTVDVVVDNAPAPPAPPAPTGRPDLVVTQVISIPTRPRAGQLVTFVATVKNSGGSATPDGTYLGAAFLVDGHKVSWSSNSKAGLVPGASRTLRADGGLGGSASWRGTAGNHTVRAVVDDVDRIPESDESNNARQVPLLVTLR